MFPAKPKTIYKIANPEQSPGAPAVNQLNAKVSPKVSSVSQLSEFEQKQEVLRRAAIMEAEMMKQKRELLAKQEEIKK